MCGVIGYVGSKPCARLIFDGLKRLEYRGYDSAGVAVLNHGKIDLVKAEGKLVHLEPRLVELPGGATMGMGHTRWATHGAPTARNAHPHLHGDLVIIHNGIIENYRELKEQLIKSGVEFKSDTDTEVVLHQLHAELDRTGDLKTAIMETVKHLRGAYALGIIHARDPGKIYVVKQGSPVVLGAGNGENFFGSDALALLPHTNRAVFMMDGEFACLTADSIDVWDFSGKPVRRDPQVLNWSAASADKQGFKHYMLKEIHEQPAVISSMLSRLVDLKSNSFVDKETGIDALDLGRVKNVAIVACGTAHYAGQIGRYMIEEFARLPANVELASEFRYRNPCIDSSTLLIAVSQSGETADTLACVKHAAERGCQVMSVCNVRFSSIPRASNAVLYMEAGPEVGVASTKAFTAMVLSFYILSLAIGEKLGRMGPQAHARLEKSFDAMRRLPSLVDRAVNAAGVIEEISHKIYESQNMLFIGRGASFPVATEGALKLKEISYIHAEGYAGGELKHGPIALVDRHMPVVSIAPRDSQYEKMISNIEEVRARQGRIIGVGDLEDDRFRSICEHYIPCPQVDDDHLQAILSVIPLQLLAYYAADMRGTDVDQPRNLAKSVTVE